MSKRRPHDSSELSTDESSSYWFPELTANSLVSNETAFNQLEREQAPVRCVSLISQCLRRRWWWWCYDQEEQLKHRAFDPGTPSDSQQLIKTIYGRSSYFGLKDNISWETPLNADICRECGTYSSSCGRWQHSPSTPPQASPGCHPDLMHAPVGGAAGDAVGFSMAKAPSHTQSVRVQGLVPQMSGRNLMLPQCNVSSLLSSQLILTPCWVGISILHETMRRYSWWTQRFNNKRYSRQHWFPPNNPNFAVMVRVLSCGTKLEDFILVPKVWGSAKPL